MRRCWATYCSFGSIERNKGRGRWGGRTKVLVVWRCCGKLPGTAERLDERSAAGRMSRSVTTVLAVVVGGGGIVASGARAGLAVRWVGKGCTRTDLPTG